MGLVEMTTRAGKAGGNLMIGLLLLFAHCTLDYFSIIQFKQNVRTYAFSPGSRQGRGLAPRST